MQYLFKNRQVSLADPVLTVHILATQLHQLFCNHLHLWMFPQN